MSTALFSTRLASRKNVPERSAEMVPLLKRTGTCRNLFGPVDHDELKRELATKLREISERDQLRWNFNFSEGRPLDGDLKWEKSPAEGCPEFYKETTPVSKRPFVDLPTTETIVQRVAPKCEGSMKIQKKVNRRRLSRKRSQTMSQTNMRITDFYVKRKKTEIVRKESRNMD